MVKCKPKSRFHTFGAFSRDVMAKLWCTDICLFCLLGLSENALYTLGRIRQISYRFHQKLCFPFLALEVRSLDQNVSTFSGSAIAIEIQTFYSKIPLFLKLSVTFI